MAQVAALVERLNMMTEEMEALQRSCAAALEAKSRQLAVAQSTAESQVLCFTALLAQTVPRSAGLSSRLSLKRTTR